MSGVSVIDLAAFEAGEGALASEVDRACRETGFLAISGHGVSETVIAGVRAAASALFDAPRPVKEAVRAGPGKPYGYLGLGTEALAKSKGEETPPDLKESFNGGPLGGAGEETDPDALAFCHAETPWPDVPGFRAAWEAYYREMEALAVRIMGLFAVALGLPPDHFAKAIDRPISALRALNYPAAEVPPEVGQQRAGAHTDYGSLTILLPDPGSRGLQILTPGGDWRAVDPVPGAFLINIGDLMELWTSGRWRSTLHRVVVPPELAGQRRMSLAFFHQPNWHAEVAPLFGGGARPVRSGPYLMAKFAAANG